MNTRVLKLNSQVDWQVDLPGPSKFARLMRSIVNTFKIRNVKRREDNANAPDIEASDGEEKSPTEKALEKYRQTLQDTFGSSVNVDSVMSNVNYWVDGL